MGTGLASCLTYASMQSFDHGPFSPNQIARRGSPRHVTSVGDRHEASLEGDDQSNPDHAQCLWKIVTSTRISFTKSSPIKPSYPCGVRAKDGS